MVSSRYRHPSQVQSPPVVKPLLAGCLMFAIVGLMFDFHGLRQWLSPSSARRSGQVSQPSQCNKVVQSEARLTREQLAELLTVPERDTKERIREIVAEPYCRLPAIDVRSGVSAERESYPLAFDPETQLVLLFENDEYAGYRFSFE
ncbi:hypothetical protein C7271_00760 [filamentous cyanobacterium CCP5]|nr:hypothetical protein C7271_00760 [filamentous cyanobacterium CCP5]